MRALVIDDSAAPSIRLVPIPDQPGECLIRVRMAGICGTDLEILRGYAGFTGIPGHEFVGIVERAPARAASWIGRAWSARSTLDAGRADPVATACGSTARTGRSSAFAAIGRLREYLSLPPENLHSVPDALGDEQAVFVEPVAAACRSSSRCRSGSPPGPRSSAMAAWRC